MTFWQLSTYDLSPPAAKYEEETMNLRKLSSEADYAYNAAEKAEKWVENRTIAGIPRPTSPKGSTGVEYTKDVKTPSSPRR